VAAVNLEVNRGYKIGPGDYATRPNFRMKTGHFHVKTVYSAPLFTISAQRATPLEVKTYGGAKRSRMQNRQ